MAGTTLCISDQSGNVFFYNTSVNPTALLASIHLENVVAAMYSVNNIVYLTVQGSNILYIYDIDAGTTSQFTMILNYPPYNCTQLFVNGNDVYVSEKAFENGYTLLITKLDDANYSVTMGGFSNKKPTCTVETESNLLVYSQVDGLIWIRDRFFNSGNSVETNIYTANKLISTANKLADLNESVFILDSSNNTVLIIAYDPVHLYLIESRKKIQALSGTPVDICQVNNTIYISTTNGNIDSFQSPNPLDPSFYDSSVLNYSSTPIGVSLRGITSSGPFLYCVDISNVLYKIDTTTSPISVVSIIPLVSASTSMVTTPDWVYAIDSSANILEQVQINPPPAPPTDISATLEYASISLSWSPPTGTITGYNVYTSTNGGATFVLNTTTSSTATSATLNGLPYGLTYTCAVKSVNRVLTSSYSSLSIPLFITPPVAPDAPTQVVATSTASTIVNLSWSPPAYNGNSPITSYRVYNGGVRVTTNITFDASSAILTGLTDNVPYRFTVSAVNVIGEGPKSANSNTVMTTPLASSLSSFHTSNSTTNFTNALVAISDPADAILNARVAINNASNAGTLTPADRQTLTVAALTALNPTNATQVSVATTSTNSILASMADVNTTGTIDPSLPTGYVIPSYSASSGSLRAASIDLNAQVVNGKSYADTISQHTGYFVFELPNSIEGSTYQLTLINGAASLILTYNGTVLIDQNQKQYTANSSLQVGNLIIPLLGLGSAASGTTSLALVTVNSSEPLSTPYAHSITSSLESAPVVIQPKNLLESIVVLNSVGATVLGESPGTLSGSLPLVPGTNTFTIRVTSEDGGATDDYSLVITTPLSSNTNLTSVAINGETLTVNDRTYSKSFNTNASSASVVITAEEAHATIVVTKGNTVVVPNSLALGPGLNTFTVTVTAQDGTIATYTLAITNPPLPPTGVSGTRGNQQVSLSWTAPTAGPTPTSYQVYVSTDSGATYTASNTSNTLSTTVESLTNGTSYRFKVKSVVDGLSSADSNVITLVPATVPGAPTIVSATTGANASSVISWAAPASNGATITGYTVTSSPDGITATTNGTGVTVSGLTNGRSYTFTVKATNSAGEGPDSIPSVAVIPTLSAPRKDTVPCFPAGTRILTPSGYKTVETLVQNELVLTADGRQVPVKVYGKHLPVTNTMTAPYKIPKGVFGLTNDIVLSPDHAFQIRKGLWMLPRKAALLSDRVEQVAVGKPVTYYHLECPQYLRDNLVANGNVVESYAGKSNNLYTYSEKLKGYTRSLGSKSISKAHA